MSDTIRIKLYVGTGFPSARHEDIWEVSREWWESLTEDQQEKELEKAATDYLWECVECSAWVLGDDEDE